eukprot:COSAG01_NODE_40500_length_462_cov_19.002755_1_plen_44_part_10
MHENVGDFLVSPDRERIFHTRAGGGGGEDGGGGDKPLDSPRTDW